MFAVFFDVSTAVLGVVTPLTQGLPVSLRRSFWSVAGPRCQRYRFTEEEEKTEDLENDLFSHSLRTVVP